MQKSKIICYGGILIAMEIIITRFVQIPLQWIPLFELSKDRISLGFVPVALAGTLLGPAGGLIVGGVSDIIRAIILPVGGAFNPLFTITAALRGFIYGLFLHKKVSLSRIFSSSAVIFIFVNTLLNTLFVSVSYGTPFSAFLVTKLFANIANFIIQIIVLGITTKPLTSGIKRIRRD